MKWLLETDTAHLPHTIQDHVDVRLRYALARFGSRIERVTVFLRDRNGPKGGFDKVCRIMAKVRGCGEIVVGVIDTDWAIAVDRATTRIGHTVSRQLGRLRETRRRVSPVRFARQLSGLSQ